MVPPHLLVVIDLEGEPRLFLLGWGHEDERRLRRWLTQPTVRRRLIEAIEQSLEAIREAA